MQRGKVTQVPRSNREIRRRPFQPRSEVGRLANSLDGGRQFGHAARVDENGASSGDFRERRQIGSDDRTTGGHGLRDRDSIRTVGDLWTYTMRWGIPVFDRASVVLDRWGTLLGATRVAMRMSASRRGLRDEIAGSRFEGPSEIGVLCPTGFLISAMTSKCYTFLKAKLRLDISAFSPA
jgi:hypothetical protein